MRILFLVPDLDRSRRFKLHKKATQMRLGPLRRFVPQLPFATHIVFGGTLNILRHCAVAQSVGADAYVATMSGRDTFGPTHGIQTDRPLRFVSWHDRTPEDVCLVPDFVSRWADDVQGPCIVYEQNPIQVRADFDYRRDDRILWTDSPFMLEICQRILPGKDIEIVPNVVDHRAFPFVPQSQRTRGELLAFPRKGPEFIQATFDAYRAQGGRYWNLVTVDGLPFHELAQRFATPQAFLASADTEGCALPPQEAMAAGVLVIGKDASGANFCMRDGETALLARTPEQAASALLRAEDDALRERLATRGHEAISRFFAHGEPADFWRGFLRRLEERVAARPAQSPIDPDGNVGAARTKGPC